MKLDLRVLIIMNLDFLILNYYFFNKALLAVVKTVSAQPEKCKLESTVLTSQWIIPQTINSVCGCVCVRESFDLCLLSIRD